MIGKHVDLIALGVLLGGLAFYCHARDMISFKLEAAKRIAIDSRLQHRIVVTPPPPPVQLWHD